MSINKIRMAITNSPYNGNNTNHHDQLITPTNFNIINANPNKLRNVILLLVTIFSFIIACMFHQKI